MESTEVASPGHGAEKDKVFSGSPPAGGQPERCSWHLSAATPAPKATRGLLQEQRSEPRPPHPGPTEMGTMWTQGRDLTPRASTSSELRDALRPRAYLGEDLPLGKEVKAPPGSAELKPRQKST